ncbi:MAG TPA: Hsp20/alpha crystallin family protein [Candidatus Binataceae bacterium]|jgi:HSP20 family protein|nr:Hsp20/alpha crystallin family protein [Candidatus Binataceae bacterium]
MDLLIGNGYTNGWLYDRVNQLNRLFNEGNRAATEAHLVPRSDVVEHGEGYHFYFEMPGIKADSVQVQVEDDSLVIEAERKRPEWPKDSAIHVSERSYGTMRRTFTMPEDASAEGIKATYRDGVLEVTVAKKPEAKPTKIKVDVEN